jgi:2-hydroxychromene-2-carboxylate isomerase
VFESTQFVFSFRSPYAWIATKWVLPQLPAGFELQWRPFFPLPSFRNFPPLLEAKTRYLARDVMRLVEHYGGSVRFPGSDDPDWAIPHCAFAAADERGHGSAFALAVWEARFGRGEDVASETVLEQAAESVGLGAAAILDAALDPANRDALTAQVQHDYTEHGIFGVPTLILPRGTRYWGHDRIEWAIREAKIPA